MIARGKLLAMLALQDSMNAKVNPDWINAGYPWMRAVLVEGGEAMDHYGWKWWKSQPANIEQFRIELVDIWHFALSHTLVYCGGDHERAADLITAYLNEAPDLAFDNQYYDVAKLDVLAKASLMIGLAASNRFSFGLFESLMGDAGMDWDALHTGYVSKNVLNFFRQDNGYKTGTYIKHWFGKEDNVVLAEIMAAGGVTSAEELYGALTARYADVLRNHQPPY